MNKEEKFALEDFGMSEISAGKKTKQPPICLKNLALENLNNFTVGKTDGDTGMLDFIILRHINMSLLFDWKKTT